MSAATHWLEVADRRGLLPVQLLGPYASADLATRARRGVLRVLNAGRYAVRVVSDPAESSTSRWRAPPARPRPRNRSRPLPPPAPCPA